MNNIPQSPLAKKLPAPRWRTAGQEAGEPTSRALTSDDYRKLEARWIPRELAERAGIFRVNSTVGAQMMGRNGSGNYSGLIIPNIAPGEEHIREYCLRRDHPDLESKPDGGTREKGKYLHPPGRENQLYFPPGTTVEQLADTTLPVALVEGAFKALALFRLSLYNVEKPRWLVIGISGCWNWRGRVGKTTGPDGGRCDVKGPIPDLDRIAWNGRLTLLVPDTNVTGNPSVQAAWREFAKEIERRGAPTVMVEVPNESGINGIDDYLSRHDPEAGLALFEAAKPRNSVNDFHLSDLGNAQRLVHGHGRDLRFVSAWGWMSWDGMRWRKDDIGAVERYAKATVLSMYEGVGAIQDDEARKNFLKFVRRSESRQSLTAMVDLAQSEFEVVARPSEFDGDPWLLNVSNGTLDLRNSELRPHNRKDLITRLTPVRWNPEADCPLFLTSLHQIFNGNKRLVRFVQKLGGYSLTGLTTEQILIILWGMGANGKSTLVEVLSALLGEYAAKTPTSTFLLKRNDSIPNDLAALQGVRFAYASEVEEGRRLSESLVKDVTGGEKIRARFLHREWFEFQPEFKLWLSTNHKPIIKGTDHAIWRRIRLVPFQVTFPPEKQDKGLAQKLKTELSGILNWAVEGCLAWQREGLEAPEEVVHATEGYREEMDTLAAFLRERTEAAPAGGVSAKALYKAYCAWCEENGERPQTPKALGMRLGERGYSSTHKATGNCWIGLRLR